MMCNFLICAYFFFFPESREDLFVLRFNVPVNNFSVMSGRRIQGGEKQTHFCTFSHHLKPIYLFSRISMKQKNAILIAFVLTQYDGLLSIRMQLAILLQFKCPSFRIALDDVSRRIRKQAICICENKGADQLRSNCEADQRLCFRYVHG